MRTIVELYSKSDFQIICTEESIKNFEMFKILTSQLLERTKEMRNDV